MGETHPHSRRLGAARAVIVTIMSGGLALTGCTGSGSEFVEPQGGPTITATILEPPDSTTDVVTSTAILFATENAVDATVELADIAGNSVDGETSPDGSRWRPAGQLEWDTTYVATLTAVSAEGEPVIATSTFTTMAQPANTVRVFSFLASDNQIGVAMPLRIEFTDDNHVHQQIPEAFRAEVERRMQVRSEPPQDGTWHWRSGSEVHYRPKEFWEPGTQIHYRLTTGGLPIGDDRYLRNDLNVSLSVGRDIRMSVDADTRQMTVREDGDVVRTIPVSLGRRDYPSSTGTFVIMEKYPEYEFNTLQTLGPDDGYVVDVEYAMRLTTGGEFIHADVRDGSALGNDNVTHGCINMSRDNAEWLFDLTHRWGDPVTITNTTRRHETGNGWTDWNASWEEYQRGSALFDG